MQVILNKLNEILEYVKKTNPSRYMDISEVSEFSGVSKSTIRRNVKDGKISASNTTGKLLFKASDVENWLNG